MPNFLDMSNLYSCIYLTINIFSLVQQTLLVETTKIRFSFRYDTFLKSNFKIWINDAGKYQAHARFKRGYLFSFVKLNATRE